MSSNSSQSIQLLISWLTFSQKNVFNFSKIPNTYFTIVVKKNQWYHVSDKSTYLRIV